MALAIPAAEIKLLLVLDSESVERTNFHFEDNDLAELLIEAEVGTLRVGITDIQRSELEAHLNEQIAQVRSVGRALVAGAGKKRVTGSVVRNEADGIHLPRLLSNAAIAAAATAMADTAESLKSELKAFFTSKNVEIIPTGGITADRVIPAYFHGEAPFGPGRKKAEFPDAISIAAIRDLVGTLTDGAEAIVVSGDDDWARAFSDEKTIRFYSSIGEALQYVRKLEAVGDTLEDLLIDKATSLNEAVREAFEQLGFSNYEYWDADVADVAVENVVIDSITVIKSINRIHTLDASCTIKFSCIVTYSEGEYHPFVSARVTASTSLEGVATVVLAPTLDAIDTATFKPIKNIIPISFEEADSVEEIYDDDPDE